MTDTTPTPSVEEVLAITDPGDVGRENHSKIDRMVIHIGNVVAWAFPILMVAIVAQVISTRIIPMKRKRGSRPRPSVGCCCPSLR